jgi:hypothetical protein
LREVLTWTINGMTTNGSMTTRPGPLVRPNYVILKRSTASWRTFLDRA